MKSLINDAETIIRYSIECLMPDKAIEKVLNNYHKTTGKTVMIAIGKAAYSMGKKASEMIKIDDGLIITKYGHSKGDIERIRIIEAGHPIPDENSIVAAKTAIETVNNLTDKDTVLFLISGGGSSLFDDPLITLDELQYINNRLLKSGADINEINIVRKRLSRVKGGKFAKMCKPARIINIVLSDIIGDPLENIASGPTIKDSSNNIDAVNIIDKYQIEVSEETRKLLNTETVKNLDNVETYIAGNNDDLKQAAAIKAKELGYKTIVINDPITSDINDAKDILVKEIDKYKEYDNIAIIAGGEITVKVTGNGLGGRNQELSLRTGKELKDDNIIIAAFGSDGTDGPTDFAGAIIQRKDINEEVDIYLDNNDSYHYLLKHGHPVITGPTGTNVCDLYLILKKEL